MNITEARAYHDGVDFYADNIIIRVKRDANGEVKATREKWRKLNKRSFCGYFLGFMFFFFYCIILNYLSFVNSNLACVLLLVMGWLFAFIFYYTQSQEPSNEMVFKYHAAQHKILNYLKKYDVVNIECDKVMKMNSFLDKCGSNFIAIVLIEATCITIGHLIFSWVIANIIWLIGSLILTYYLWNNGKCDFFQKLTILEPSREEIEVVCVAVREYVKLKSERER